MRCLIVLSGSLEDGPLLQRLLQPCDYLVAADGGSDHLRRLDILPDLIVGDFDSIAPESRPWIEKNRIPVHRFPTAKNATDSEIALDAALANIPEGVLNAEVELVFLGALGSRPDHVLGNQMMAAALAEKGYRVSLSDGISLICAVHGPGELTLDLAGLPDIRWAISTISVTPAVTGLTYTGLQYPLDQFTLPFGSSRGLSNEPAQPGGLIRISLTSGTAMVCLTPAD